MANCYVGLGSNLGDPIQHIKSALVDLQALPQTRLQRYSSLYRSEPVGPVAQADFINAVALLDSQLSPDSLLAGLQQIEDQHQRVRTGERWGPRTLDLDLLLYDELQIAKRHLSVPHKEIPGRAFVLVPLLELDAELDIPGQGRAATLLQALDQTVVSRLDNE
ncbi:MAG: 2-amino-4-hydroxy-6-hydroxymethyldihydropteridine diphosphokinase [Gammaproteobacteria bacterium]